jgi:hypothetical protein
MRHACHVGNTVDHDAVAAHSTNGCIAAKTDALYKDIDVFQAVLAIGDFSSSFSGDLGGVCRTLLAAAESASTGTASSNDVALFVGKGDDRIVKCCLNM